MRAAARERSGRRRGPRAGVWGLLGDSTRLKKPWRGIVQSGRRFRWRKKGANPCGQTLEERGGTTGASRFETPGPGNNAMV